MKISLCNNWQFSRQENFEQFEEVRIPHANHISTFSYCDEQEYQFSAFYRTFVEAKAEWLTKCLLLTFDGVGHHSEVFINDKKVAEHNCGYTSFTVDIAPFVVVGQNEIKVKVDASHTLNQPPFGNVVDYQTFGGIYREVHLDIREKMHISDIFVKGYGQKKPYNLCAEITLSKCCEGQELSIECVVIQEQKTLMTYTQKVSQNVETFFAAVDDAKLWDIASPVLATFEVTLSNNGVVCDKLQTTFGFRDVCFTPNGFYLNDKKVDLIGLNRHQSFAYVGYAMPSRVQKNDARILKEELCVNIVRTSHYPQSQHFLNECDRLGLLVFTEIPGWQHIGDQEWKGIACKNTEEMVKQNRNHPSIVCWGVRINESGDDDEFYRQTNQIAHDLDDSRQTAGVRYIAHSNCIEDIYSYNDFIHWGKNRATTPKRRMYKGKKPMLVTEHNGHMYPTKSFDDEPHRTEQALRHARVVNSFVGARHLCGGIGWCMADYNTCKFFGSGDRICHHGVMDMFRNPKLAASLYSSQGERAVLEVSSSMDKGEWPASRIDQLVIFTNADFVRVWRNGKTLVGDFYPDYIKFKHLKHPPVFIKDFIGDALIQQEKFSKSSSKAVKSCIYYCIKKGLSRIPTKYKLAMLFVCLKEKISVEKLTKIAIEYGGGWGTGDIWYTFEAIKDGALVKSTVKRAACETYLWAEADSTLLCDGDTYDVASIRIKAVDRFGNALTYCNRPVHFTTSGNIRIVGPDTVTLLGGYAGTYVATTGKGRGTINISFDKEDDCRTIDFLIR